MMLDWLSTVFYTIQPYLRFPDILRYVLDILFVAFLIYQILLLIRQTRAEQVLKGIVIIIVITLASRLLKFNTILWILENTIQFGVIAIAIVFQPEIRKALEQIGRGRFILNRFFSLTDQGEIDKLIDEITVAVTNMSKAKIGALIVIEQETGVNDIIETGVKIEAKLSRELLENVFVPQTPLHDGAVVLRDNKIQAAGCFLPLTENTNLSKQLGTRHRAALGISEICDAVVIVVSEETGVISMARDGRLTRYLDETALRKILSEIYVPQEEQTRKSRRA